MIKVALLLFGCVNQVASVRKNVLFFAVDGTFTTALLPMAIPFHLSAHFVILPPFHNAVATTNHIQSVQTNACTQSSTLFVVYIRIVLSALSLVYSAQLNPSLHKYARSFAVTAQMALYPLPFLIFYPLSSSILQTFGFNLVARAMRLPTRPRCIRRTWTS